ncbi:MAG: phosphatidylinositol-3-phosphatase [Gaiellales bacterium]|jgi:phospholipase C|nr:phosphatidylinositol-3-phosphatase [Gaiellales bacterium]MDX6544390.1 phosphatidylinositol-3-phosphatase [Gaiellales bacterium]MDX6549935.1 phosphatidylinositol-3-phosphatase [Gaiellales bacterium]
MMRRWPLLCVVLLVAGLVSAGDAGARPVVAPHSLPHLAAPLCGGLAGQRPGIDHVIVIVMENHSYADLIGGDGSAAATRAPYLNGTLKKGCGLATNYHAVTHPSLPNYIALVAGSTGGISSDCTTCTTAAGSLFGQLRQNGRGWKVFAESMPSNCSGIGTNRYVKRHNPPTYFPRLAADCARWDAPMGAAPAGRFATALRNGWLPPYTMVVPDMCNDMHDCPIGTGDVWLSRWIPRIAATAGYQQGHTVVLLTWDEGEGSGNVGGVDCLAHLGNPSCHVPALVISAVTPAGTRSATLFSHYSLLRTAEALLGMPRFLGRAATSASMRGAFGL